MGRIECERALGINVKNDWMQMIYLRFAHCLHMHVNAWAERTIVCAHYSSNEGRQTNWRGTKAPERHCAKIDNDCTSCPLELSRRARHAILEKCCVFSSTYVIWLCRWWHLLVHFRTHTLIAKCILFADGMQFLCRCKRECCLLVLSGLPSSRLYNSNPSTFNDHKS